MARTVADYTHAMLALLPIGPAWPRDQSSWWGLWFKAISAEFVRAEKQHEQLLKEMSPATTELLLEAYETDYALPDPCLTQDQTISERREALFVKATSIGQQNKQFFIDTAKALGYDITITEYSSANPGTQTSYQNQPIAGDAWNFVWQINASLENYHARRYGSAYGELYSTFGNEQLECAMRAVAHDHRVLFFSYT